MDKKKILLIDDEPDLVETVTFRLELNGYEVISASDGQDGLAKAKTAAPDLIICDWMLPKMDGYKVCQILKQDPVYSKIPVVLFTAKAQQEDQKLGKEAGADGYIIKPFQPQQLLSKVKELLGHSAV